MACDTLRATIRTVENCVWAIALHVEGEVASSHFAAALCTRDGSSVAIAIVVVELERLDVHVTVLALHGSILAQLAMLGRVSSPHFPALLTVRAPNERKTAVDTVLVHVLIGQRYVAAVFVF